MSKTVFADGIVEVRETKAGYALRVSDGYPPGVIGQSIYDAARALCRRYPAVPIGNGISLEEYTRRALTPAPQAQVSHGGDHSMTDHGKPPVFDGRGAT